MNEVLMNIIGIIITLAGVAVVERVLIFLNKKIDEVQKNTELIKYEQLNKHIDVAQNVIGNVVLTVSQTFVDSLKSSGTFDKAAQIEAKNKAIELAKKMITKESKDAIVTLYKDFNEFLDSTIESYVKQNKQN